MPVPTLLLTLTLTAGVYFSYVSIGPINAYVPIALVALAYVLCTSSANAVWTAFRSTVPLFCLAVFALLQEFFLSRELASRSYNQMICAFYLFSYTICLGVLAQGERRHQVVAQLLRWLYIVGVFSSLLLVAQVLVSFHLFDFVGYTNRLGLSNIGEVNDYVNLTDTSCIRGRGLAPSVHTFAATLIIPLCIGIVYWKRWKLIPRTYGILLLALFFNRSVTAIAALGVTLLLYQYRKGRWGATKALIAACAIPAAIAGLAYFAYETYYLRGLDTMFYDQNVNTLTARLFSWDRAVEMFLESPLIGVGGGNFKALVDQYQGFFLPNTLWLKQEAHSIYLHMLSQYGAIGTVLFVGIWIRPLCSRQLLVTPIGSALWLSLTALLLKATLGNEYALVHIYLLATLAGLYLKPAIPIQRKPYIQSRGSHVVTQGLPA